MAFDLPRHEGTVDEPAQARVDGWFEFQKRGRFEAIEGCEVIALADMMRARGGSLVNADVTLICEQPKVKPHREAMRARVADLLGLPLERVSVKATTMEKMGFTGREEGLAASAVVAVETPA